MGPGHSGAAPIALTFDDGPDPTWTPLVLDALAEARVTATFFVVAPRAERHPSLVARMRDEGHGVAFHCNGRGAPLASGAGAAAIGRARGRGRGRATPRSLGR